uniref:Gustatory receptor n=1 Tax=Timema shepardi TaxID=629360 RepID=A0A7R9G1Q0_TIMSH|nr:unnamed protein product [Timema shepardi]
MGINFIFLVLAIREHLNHINRRLDYPVVKWEEVVMWSQHRAGIVGVARLVNAAYSVQVLTSVTGVKCPAGRDDPPLVLKEKKGDKHSLRQLSVELECDKNGKEVIPFFCDLNIGGCLFVALFILARNPELSVRKAKGISLARAQGMCKEESETYFTLLRDLLSKHEILNSPGTIYNNDETGLQYDETGLQLNNKPENEVARTFTLSHKERELKQFSLQLLHNKIQFTAGGFLPLDYTLVHSVVAASTMYLIILLQFQLSSKPTNEYGREFNVTKCLNYLNQTNSS